MTERRSAGIVVCAVVLAGLLPRGAGAEDVGLAGKKLLLTGSASRGRLVAITKGSVPSWPAPDASNNPTRAGAQLLVINPLTRESATLDLPAAGWSARADGRVLKYRNKAAPAGPSAVKLVNFKEKKGLKLGAKSTAITLDEPSQHAVGVILRLGALQYCAVFGGKVTKDKPGRFVAKKAPAPGSCPLENLCGNGRADGGEECGEPGLGCAADETCVNCRCVGVGDVSVQLVWANENDLDLHVVDPNGEEIYWSHRSSASGGELDQDANAGCGSVTVSPIENVFWPTGTAPTGEYIVLVTSFTTCSDATDTPFTVRTIVDGVPTEHQGVASGQTFCGECPGCGTCQEVTRFTR